MDNQRLSQLDWQHIRARYEAGETAQQIADAYAGRVSVKTIRNRRAIEGWGNNIHEKPTGIATTATRSRNDTRKYCHCEEAEGRRGNPHGKNPTLEAKIIAEYQKIAFANIKYFGALKNGELIIENLDNLNEADACAISEISKTPQGYKIKLYDKLDALNILAKHVGLLDSKNTSSSTTADNNNSPQKPLEIILKELQF